MWISEFVVFTRSVILWVLLIIEYIQISTGKDDKGLKLYDPGYINTAPVRSSICYIDGDEGILRYRGYPIEQLAESSSFLEVAYLLSKTAYGTILWHSFLLLFKLIIKAFILFGISIFGNYSDGHSVPVSTLGLLLVLYGIKHDHSNDLSYAVYGNLPSKSQLADWEFAVSQHSAVPQGILVYFSLYIIYYDK